MHPQLEAIRTELQSAQDRLHHLVQKTPPTQWARRADPARWSIAECVAHLNLTGQAFLPLLDTAVTQARQAHGNAPRHYRRDPFGWLLWRLLGDGLPLRFPTAPAFIPTDTADPATLVTEFDRLQTEQVRYLEAADGRPLDRIRVASPFAPGRSYNLYACFTILARHQHRHLRQAERVWAHSHP